MATFRTLSADDVRAILDGYEALGATSYRAHAAVAAGAINTNVRVETARGPVFLRINEGKTRDDVAREAAIVSHAAARGVPTPAPLHARDGEFFEEWRGELASVFPWAPGRTLARADVGPAHAALVGAALARLHLASPGYADHRPGRYEPDEIRSSAAPSSSARRLSSASRSRAASASAPRRCRSGSSTAISSSTTCSTTRTPPARPSWPRSSTSSRRRGAASPTTSP
jgi:Ser/Thr protein kinase RdoA (MazF antagonist)